MGCICNTSAALFVKFCLYFARSDEDESKSIETQIQQLIKCIKTDDTNGVILWLNNVSQKQVC